ncbi:GntR family transcriptional regulator [Arthrobacter sp. SLBN-83]|uniref:FadR/GntR family transcriptional regulator n=1 Tax=Arthrobacter sp. SLBN-83 TaxID=2768449 RepID=UPI00114F380A|nr:FCD domain-containing protein [Arthrobacter sp. SLBN-83]TQJ58146.1 GntR family transcriptional regulator [Arthrobacter sp. SLBN-83]
MTSGAANGSMSQTDVVISGVKRMLSSRRLKPGDRLPIEKDLAAELQVSRGSLREGVRALSTMGILETKQGAGTFVTRLEPSALLSAMEFWVGLQDGERANQVHTVRRALETEAAAAAAICIVKDKLDEAEGILDRAHAAIHANPVQHEAAMQCDVEFHRLIAEASANHVLSALIETVSTNTIRGRMWRSMHDNEGLLATHREHLGILEALRRHDVDRARTRMANHLYAVEDYVTAIPEPDLEGRVGDAETVLGGQDSDL